MLRCYFTLMCPAKRSPDAPDKPIETGGRKLTEWRTAPTSPKYVLLRVDGKRIDQFRFGFNVDEHLQLVDTPEALTTARYWIPPHAIQYIERIDDEANTPAA